MEIETERLLLRQWRSEDVEPYARITADPETMRYLTLRNREEAEEQIARFVWHWRERGFGLWAVEEKATGEFIGRLGLTCQEDWPGPDKMEVGWVLDRSRWGQGLATEGALASITFGFETLAVPRIISITRPENLASQRVMEKAGLTRRGLAEWRGREVVWYAIDRPTA